MANTPSEQALNRVYMEEAIRWARSRISAGESVGEIRLQMDDPAKWVDLDREQQGLVQLAISHILKKAQEPAQVEQRGRVLA